MIFSVYRCGRQGAVPDGALGSRLRRDRCEGQHRAMRPCWLAAALAACGGGSPAPADAVDSGSGSYDSIRLASSSLTFDDLRFAPDLGKVIAVPFGGTLYLVDPIKNAFTQIAVPTGTETADGKGSMVYAADRQMSTIVIVDATAGQVVGTAALQGGPDYIRASPTTNEVWVTLPGNGRIDYYTIDPGPP